MENENLRQLQFTEIEILDAVSQVCEKYGLKYYLVGGTLLGAVRHKGFIPWDDDLDIAMPRKDYKKFLKISEAELGKGYFLQTYQKDNYYAEAFAKIRKNNTLFVEKNCEHLKDRNHGIYIDIFPLDDGDESVRYKRPFFKKISAVIDTVIHIKVYEGRKKLVGVRARAFGLLPMRFLVILRDLLRKGKGDCYINYGSNYGVKKQTMKKDWYDPAASLCFEGKEYAVPRKYEEVLRRIYGEDYMELPPIEKRVTHNPVKISFDASKENEVWRAK